MIRYKLVDGSIIEVDPKHEEMFKIENPGAVLDTMSTSPGKLTGPASVTPIGGPDVMEFSSVPTFSEQQDLRINYTPSDTPTFNQQQEKPHFSFFGVDYRKDGRW